MDKEWYSYQEIIRDYFESIGTNAKTNYSIQGVRTKHDIDVYVESLFLGHNIKWIIEAKHWNSRVSKLHVLGLRTIVDDTGVDKGFIISENGFQKGAYEASKNSNIELITFDELKLRTDDYYHSEVLELIDKRIQIISIRYWSHSKHIRRKYGLRGELGECIPDFSAYRYLLTAFYALQEAKLKNYPIDLNPKTVEIHGKLVAENFKQFENWININLNIASQKILVAESKMLENNEFTPFYKLDIYYDYSYR